MVSGNFFYKGKWGFLVFFDFNNIVGDEGFFIGGVWFLGDGGWGFVDVGYN